MMLPWNMSTDEHTDKPENYSSYRAEKFEKYRRKIDAILRGIEDLSLLELDKEKLRKELINKLQK